LLLLLFALLLHYSWLLLLPSLTVSSSSPQPYRGAHGVLCVGEGGALSSWSLPDLREVFVCGEATTSRCIAAAAARAVTATGQSAWVEEAAAGAGGRGGGGGTWGRAHGEGGSAGVGAAGGLLRPRLCKPAANFFAVTERRAAGTNEICAAFGVEEAPRPQRTGSFFGKVFAAAEVDVSELFAVHTEAEKRAALGLSGGGGGGAEASTASVLCDMKKTLEERAEQVKNIFVAIPVYGCAFLNFL